MLEKRTLSFESKIFWKPRIPALLMCSGPALFHSIFQSIRDRHPCVCGGSALRFALDQHQPAVGGVAAHIQGIDIFSRLGCRLRIHLRASFPAMAVNADHILTQNAVDPLPATLRHQVKSGRVKADIGHDDRGATCGQQFRQMRKKSAMHGVVSIFPLRVNFLVKRHATPPAATLARNRCHCWSAVTFDCDQCPLKPALHFQVAGQRV